MILLTGRIREPLLLVGRWLYILLWTQGAVTKIMSLRELSEWVRGYAGTYTNSRPYCLMHILQVLVWRNHLLIFWQDLDYVHSDIQKAFIVHIWEVDRLLLERVNLIKNQQSFFLTIRIGPSFVAVAVPLKMAYVLLPNCWLPSWTHLF